MPYISVVCTYQPMPKTSNQTVAETVALVSNYISDKTMDIITHPCIKEAQGMISEWTLQSILRSNQHFTNIDMFMIFIINTGHW